MHSAQVDPLIRVVEPRELATEIAPSIPDVQTRAMLAPTADETPGTKARATVLVANGPYLPITGALPLRFSATRKWPAPLPAETPASEAEAIVAVNPPEPALPANLPRETPALPIALVAPSASADATTDPVSRSPAPSAPVPTALTADMVLGYLGDLPPPEARVSVRFEPAIPQHDAAATGIGALTP